MTWLPPTAIRGNSQAPFDSQIGASPAVAMAQFATVIWPDGYNSPHAFMYDMVLDTLLNYPVDYLPKNVRHSAALSVGEYLFLFGGTDYQKPPRASSIAALTRLLPKQTELVFPNDIVYGDTVQLLVHCGASSSLRVSTTSSCDGFIDSFPPQKCTPRMTINTSLIPKDIERFWICVTEGSCFDALQPAYATPCATNATDQVACLSQGCCWTREERCVAGQFGEWNTTYWYASPFSPLRILHPTAAPSTLAPIPTTPHPSPPNITSPVAPNFTTTAPSLAPTVTANLSTDAPATAAPTTTDIPSSTEWWQKNWTNNTVNSRYKGQMPPYQIFMIIVGVLCVLLGLAIAYSSRTSSEDEEDSYNPMLPDRPSGVVEQSTTNIQ
jgi:hypothetical protein